MRISDWSSDVCSSDLRPLVPMDEVDVALAGILPRRAAPPAAGDEEQRPDIRLFLGQQIFFDHVAHFERARLRRACGQAELDRDASLILVGEERSEGRRVGKECRYV